MKKPLLGRAGRLLGALAVGTTLFSVIALSGAVPAGAVTYHGGGLVSTRDTPDPDVVYSGHGTTYYTYSTGTMGLVTADWTNGGIGFTPLSCTSAGCGITGVTHTALTAYTHPSIPRGVNLGLFGLQAPSVVHLNSGTWVMYYGAVDAGSPHNAYAVWVATATHPTAVDGFTSSLTEGPIMYQKTTGGSTDPSVFTSPSGTRSLQWKSSTYRTDGDKARLWSMPLTATGLQISGSASVLITQPTTGWDSATVENPDMIYSGGTYYLFFSGGLWTTTGYGEGYVTCSSASGGCGSPTGAPFLSNSSSVPYGPGGASLFPSTTGSWLIAYHGWNTSCTKYVTSCNGLRQLYVSQMTGLAATPLPKITSFTASPASLPATGGTVTFSVISPNMTNYSISSSPAVAGLPAERPTIHLPANTTGSPITYTFTATTNNTAGFQTATASVTVNINHPVLGSFTASLASLATTGGPVTLVATGTGGTRYTFSANQPVLGLPVTVSSSTGSAHVSVIVPPNYLWTTDRVTFSASLTGTPAATTGLTVAAMQSQPTTLARFADGSTGSEYAVRSPTNSLDFYYESDGGSWVKTIIPGATAYSTPALTRFYDSSGSGTEIAFEGPSNSLEFAYQVDGGKWGVQTVTGAVAYSAPSLTRISTGTLITFEGPSHSLKFAYQTDGKTWSVQTVTGAVAYSAPSIARFSDGGNGTEIAFEGPSNSLKFAYQTERHQTGKSRQ